MDDEQRPWWTRPPEPGPEKRAAGKDGDQPAAPDLFTAPDPYAPPPAPTETNPATLPGSGQNAYPDSPRNFEPLSFPNLSPRPSSPPLPLPPMPLPPLPPAAKPVVRRVAVTQPVRPEPIRSSGLPTEGLQAAPLTSEETETLPIMDDGIFATFTGELEQVTSEASKTRPARSWRSPRQTQPDRNTGPLRTSPSGRDPLTGEPVTPGTGPLNPVGDPADRDRPSFRLLPRVPDGWVLLLAGAGGLVALLIVAVALISGRGGGNNPPQSIPKRSATPLAAQVVAGRPPQGLTQLSGDAAAALLRKAGVSPGGTIVDAWAWQDHNGHNLVATTVSPQSGGKVTLRVIHVAHLDDNPKKLRIMRDPNLPVCPGGSTGGTASFTKNALIVRDLNNDDVAEVIVGWESNCGGGDDARSEVKLALISNGDKYIVRGQGVIGQAGSGTGKPQPKFSDWPSSFRTAVQQLFSRFYF